MSPTRTPHSTSVHAFTLAEVMMATVVVLVAVVGLIQAVTIGSEMLDVAKKQTVAMLLIRNEIDNVHLRDWTTVSAMPTSATITVNRAGTGITSCSPAATAQTAFALTNYTHSYAAPYVAGSGSYDDNTTLMGQARSFSLTVAVTTVKANLLQITYSVSWTAGNQRKTYTRSGTTYYGKNGLNLYYRR